MREVTVKDMVAAFEGKVVEMYSDDSYGITFEMSRATVIYNEEYDELTFTAVDVESGKRAFITFSVEDTIECINEEDGTFTISFILDIPDVIVR